MCHMRNSNIYIYKKESLLISLPVCPSIHLCLSVSVYLVLYLSICVYIYVSLSADLLFFSRFSFVTGGLGVISTMGFTVIMDISNNLWYNA